MLKIKKKLGEGSFSKVHEAENENGEKFAVKIEKKSFYNLLEKEKDIHFYLFEKDVEKKYVVPVYDFYSDENNNYLVMEKLFNSFADIMSKINITFDDFSIRNIAKKLIEILQFIHKQGVIHCDIKPDNIMISSDFQKIYLIDYGLSRFYMRKNRHIPFSTDKNNGGTLRYMSVHTNNQVESSRRDDLISLGYVLVYLQTAKLPWQNITGKNRCKKIAEMKIDISFVELCKGCVHELIKYFEECYNYGFYDEPNYEKLINLFQNT